MLPTFIFFIQTLIKDALTKYQIFKKLPQISQTHKKRNCLSVCPLIGTFQTKSILSVAWEEYSFLILPIVSLNPNSDMKTLLPGLLRTIILFPWRYQFHCFLRAIDPFYKQSSPIHLYSFTFSLSDSGDQTKNMENGKRKNSQKLFIMSGCNIYCQIYNFQISNTIKLVDGDL